MKVFTSSTLFFWGPKQTRTYSEKNLQGETMLKLRLYFRVWVQLFPGVLTTLCGYPPIEYTIGKNNYDLLYFFLIALPKYSTHNLD
jgi:hypothetical protein